MAVPTFITDVLCTAAKPLTTEQKSELLDILPALETNMSQVENLSEMLSFFAANVETEGEEDKILWAVCDHLDLLRADLSLNVSRVYSFVWGESMVQTRERFNKVAVDKEAAS